MAKRKRTPYVVKTVKTEKTHTDKICRLLGIHRFNFISILPYLARTKTEIRDYMYEGTEYTL